MRKSVLGLYSLAHFWVDFSCALLIFGRVAPGERGVTVFLLYNFCAFALQMPLGLLADRLGGGHRFAALGCLLTAGAWALGGVPAALVTGVGNALFHVGGGVYALHGSKNCGALGIFVSPGAFGVYLGALSSVQGAIPAAAVWVGLLLLGGAILAWGRGVPGPAFDPAPVGGRPALPLLLALFAVVVLRALMGGLFAFPWRAGIWLTVAVAGGKAAGGLLADRFGRRRVADLSLGIAAICFLGSNHLLLGLIAVFAFNMTMPLTLRGAGDLLRGAGGFAFGGLTFALFLGTAPVLLGLPLPAGSGLLYAAGALLSLILLWFGLGEGT